VSNVSSSILDRLFYLNLLGIPASPSVAPTPTSLEPMLSEPKETGSPGVF
jgi:hypothetical protein